MRRHIIIFWLFCLCAIIVSCTKDDSVSEDTDSKRYEFALSVSNQHGMRMANEVVQVDKPFRGLQNLYVIPFRTDATSGEATAVTADDFPLISIATGTESNRVSGKDYYYMGYCSLRAESNRVLVYGQAMSYNDNPAQNGLLNTGVGNYIVPADISFSLQSICETTTANADAQALADYLTTIANTEGWSTDGVLKFLYLDFIQAGVERTGLLAGSAANVKAYVSTLKARLEEIKEAGSTSDATKDLCNAIIGNIVDDAAACVNNGYPGTLGLPDGVAALRWSREGLENKFLVRTQTTTLDNINNITRYTYPAELWYYTNSTIRTSKKRIWTEAIEGAADWSALLNHYDGKYISVETQSVAVKEPLQYGVARLHTVLTAAVADCPLTAVIIGGQHTVGFDFLPKVPKSDVDARFIYDKEVSGTETNTLVLQSYDGEKVPVVLEFQNNGSAFTGRDGIVYPGTKFYLVAYLDPAGMGEDACAGRVFTQDFTTTAQMTVSSKANAYTCIPDLLEPRLEIGVQVQMNWIQSTPTTVKL